MKIFLYYIGKPRDSHANAMAEEYIKRSTRFAKCEMREVRPDRFDDSGAESSTTQRHATAQTLSGCLCQNW